MTDVKKLITEHLDIWLTAETEKKSGRGRRSASSNSIYGIQKLRELILDLAVTGKLVSHSKDSANKLVNEILTIRDQKAKEENLKTSASSIDQEGSYFVSKPLNWEWVRLGNLAKFIDYRGKTPKKIDTGIPLITAKNVRFGYLDEEPREYISEKDYQDWMTRGFPKVGDLLFTTEAPLGNISEINLTYQFALAQRVICFQLHKSEISSFLKLFIMSNKFQNLLFDESTGMTATGIKASKLKELPICLPLIEEQQRIVAKVDELMQLCDQLEQRYSLSLEAHAQLVDTLLSVLSNSSDADEFKQNWQHILKNFDLLFTTEYSMELLKQTILQLAVIGKLVKQDSNDEPASVLVKQIAEEKEKLVKEGKIKKSKLLPEKKLYENTFTNLPNNWILTNLANLAEINPRNNMIDDSIFVSFVPMTLIHREYLNKHEAETKTWAEVKKGFTHFANNDIGVAKITPCFENSKACVFQNLINDVGAGTTELHIVRPIVGLDSEYVLIYFKSPVFLKTGEAHMTGTAGQKRLPKEFVEYFNFPLPPLNEQKRIVEKVNQLFSMIDTLQTLQCKLQRTKLHLSDSLVTNAVSASNDKNKLVTKDNIIHFEKPIEAIKQSSQKVTDQIDLFTDESVEDDLKLLSLAAEITFQLHTEPTFGHLKLQKLIYLCQQLKHMDLSANFKQHAAGPYDPVMARYLDKEFKDREWFSYDPKRDLKYKPLGKCNDHRSAFNRYFAKDVSEIYNLIGLFRTSKSDHIEIVATLFACWLRLLEKKLSVTEEQLLKDFYAWSEEKNRFSKAVVLNSYKWMKQNSVVPL